ncbi:DUF4179 domain-containing protein [Lutispora thermophila]|uniref:DUF4179 domain-containing protein n=1 Tax=Lutispora thermophila DSM 19022 TaxID=1122184 RepID=A0A1M6IKU7_9FIRM|nr:DUF4179 domain-containing protein [Lutispora thermophila]SHJ35068.1 protein of unknown function [Lutispora thermophila DSM 19022]
MKESNDIYNLLNQVNFNIEDYEKEELSDMEKQKLKNSFRRRNKRITKLKWASTIVAALVLVSVAAVNYTNFGGNVYAAAQSKISEISYSIGKALGIERNIETYTNIVGQFVEDKGIEVKLTDVVIDKDELIFCIVAHMNQPIDMFRFDYDIFIDGKKIKNFGVSGSAGPIDDSGTLFFATYAVDIKDIDTNKNVDIRIVLKDCNLYLAGKTEQEIRGKWEFEFTANGDDLRKSTNVVPIDYSFNIDNTIYTLEELRYNPINQKIIGKIENISEEFYVIELDGEDSLGNKVVFGLSSMDDKNIIFKYEKVYGNLSDEITSITLTPYAAKQSKESGRESNDYKQVGEKFTIFLNK